MNVRLGGPADGALESMTTDGRHHRPSVEGDREEEGDDEVDADEPLHVRLMPAAASLLTLPWASVTDVT